MDLRKLEYLEAIYRLKSFTKAAKEQYVSQSSLSEAIMRLEVEAENRRAMHVYRKNGFEEMPYIEMKV